MKRDPGGMVRPELRSILVATDLTEVSDEVLRAAGALAAVLDAKLHVLHAFDFQVLPYSDAAHAHITFSGRIAEAKQALDEQIGRTVRPGVDVASREVVIYVAHRAILERAATVGADLIVLGPHRRRTLGDAVLGSTADRVIRTSEVPCLIARGPLSLPLRRVLVPIDLSKPALGALDVALAWSDALRPRAEDAPLGPEVSVLHVIPRVYDFEAFPFGETVIGPELHREVDAARARVGAAGPLDVREEVCWGDSAADEILRAAGEERADLLVLATHGHGALRRVVLGSVASAVARRARGAVLLVPPALWGTEQDGRREG